MGELFKVVLDFITKLGDERGYEVGSIETNEYKSLGEIRVAVTLRKPEKKERQ